MKLFLIVCCCAALSIGIVFLGRGIYDFPSRRTRFAMRNLKKQQETRTLSERLKQTLERLAKKLARFVPMNTLREERLQNAVDEAHLPCTAKEFTAKNIIIGLLIAVWAVPVAFLDPIIALPVVILGCLIGLREQLRTTEIAKKRRKVMEQEMAPFAQFIAQALNTSSNVRYILTTYRLEAGKTFGTELDKTIADMKTSTVQNALHNLELRVGLASLSEIIRGLHGVNNGDDQRIPFNLLAFTLHDKQQNQLKKEALKRPEKLSIFVIMMLAAMVIQVIAVVWYMISGSMQIFDF